MCGFVLVDLFATTFAFVDVMKACGARTAVALANLAQASLLPPNDAPRELSPTPPQAGLAPPPVAHSVIEALVADGADDDGDDGLP